MESVEIIWELAIVGFVAARLVWSKETGHPVPAEAPVASSLDEAPETARDASRLRFSGGWVPGGNSEAYR